LSAFRRKLIFIYLMHPSIEIPTNLSFFAFRCVNRRRLNGLSDGCIGE